MNGYLRTAIIKFLENVDVKRFFEEKVPTPEQFEEVLKHIQVDNGEVFVGGKKLGSDEPGIVVGSTKLTMREYAHKQYILYMSSMERNDTDGND